MTTVQGAFWDDLSAFIHNQKMHIKATIKFMVFFIKTVLQLAFWLFVFLCVAKTMVDQPWINYIMRENVAPHVRESTYRLTRHAAFLLQLVVSNFLPICFWTFSLGAYWYAYGYVCELVLRFKHGYSGKPLRLTASAQRQSADEARIMFYQALKDWFGGKEISPESMQPRSIMLPAPWPPYLVAIVLDGTIVGMGSRVEVPNYPNGVLISAGHVFKDLRGTKNVRLMREDKSVVMPDIPPSILTVGALDVIGFDLSPGLWSLIGVKKIKIAANVHIDEAIKTYGFNYDSKLCVTNGFITPENGMVLRHDASTIASWSGSPVINKLGRMVGIHFGSRLDASTNIAHAVTGLWKTPVDQTFVIPESKNGKRQAWIQQELIDASEERRLAFSTMKDSRNGDCDFVFGNDSVQVVPAGETAKFINRAQKLSDDIAGVPGGWGSGDYYRGVERLQNFVRASPGKEGRELRKREADKAADRARFKRLQNAPLMFDSTLLTSDERKNLDEWNLLSEGPAPQFTEDVAKQLVETVQQRAIRAKEKIRKYNEDIAILQHMAANGLKAKWSDEPAEEDIPNDEDYALINQIDHIEPESGFLAGHTSGTGVVRNVVPSAIEQWRPEAVKYHSTRTLLSIVKMSPLHLPPNTYARTTTSLTIIGESQKKSATMECCIPQVTVESPSIVDPVVAKTNASKKSKKRSPKRKPMSSPIEALKPSESVCPST
jgi:hypothetical protein